MEIIYECCVRLDIHKKNTVACVSKGSLTATRTKNT